MLVDIKETEKLKEMEKKTGRTAEKIINEILGIHLDEKKRKEYLKRELNGLFELYQKKNSCDCRYGQKDYLNRV